jgi:hypothetical protein
VSGEIFKIKNAMGIKQRDLLSEIEVVGRSDLLAWTRIVFDHEVAARQ